MIVALLFAAAIVEGALQGWAEFGLILGVIAINTALGELWEGLGAFPPRPDDSQRRRGRVCGGWCVCWQGGSVSPHGHAHTGCSRTKHS